MRVSISKELPLSPLLLRVAKKSNGKRRLVCKRSESARAYGHERPVFGRRDKFMALLHVPLRYEIASSWAAGYADTPTSAKGWSDPTAWQGRRQHR